MSIARSVGKPVGRLRLLVVADVSPVESHGGAARVIREQSRRLATRGHEVTVLCRHPGGDIPARGDIGGVPVLHYAVDRRHPLAFAVTSITAARRHFRQAFCGREWDAVIFHQPLSAVGILPLLPAALRRLYVFHSPAGDEYRLRAERLDGRRLHPATSLAVALLSRLERRALRAVSLIIVLSEFSRRVLVRTHGRLSAPVLTVPGAVDLDRFRPPADRARRSVGIRRRDKRRATGR